MSDARSQATFELLTNMADENPDNQKALLPIAHIIFDGHDYVSEDAPKIDKCAALLWLPRAFVRLC